MILIYETIQAATVESPHDERWAEFGDSIPEIGAVINKCWQVIEVLFNEHICWCQVNRIGIPVPPRSEWLISQLGDFKGLFLEIRPDNSVIGIGTNFHGYTPQVGAITGATYEQTEEMVDGIAPIRQITVGWWKVDRVEQIPIGNYRIDIVWCIPARELIAA
jgi:hypothetical protein